MAKWPWDVRKLHQPPRTFPAEGYRSKGVTALFFEGPPMAGKPTRVFAWLGLPEAKPGEKVPGIVLVHGGAGGAFARWVRQWTARGYAAVAMDTCGRAPEPEKIAPGARHDHAGPDGWGGWDQLDRPVEDQWPYHAVADVVLAHSLLRSQEQVDPNRVGIFGISWGAYLTCIAAPADGRFRFAIPVYGCGHFKEGASPIYLDRSRAMGKAAYERWHRRWDPSRFLGEMRCPALWLSGTNDLGFSEASRQLSYRAAPGEPTVCLKVRLPHNYQTPWRQKEIETFADTHAGRDVAPLPRIVAQGRKSNQVWVRFASRTKIAGAQLCYTLDDGDWRQRKWQTADAEVDAARQTARATLPDGAKVYWINLTDDRGLTVSGEHEETGPGAR